MLIIKAKLEAVESQIGITSAVHLDRPRFYRTVPATEL